jgi:hypothetical protein
MTAAPAMRQAETEDYGVHFGLVEMDLLATHAGVRFPFPLRVPEFGRIDGERDVLRAAAGVTLRARGLAGRRGPLGVAAELVTALTEYRGTVDLVLARPDVAVGAVAIVYRSWALICCQPLTGDHATTGVWIRRVAQNALAAELLAMVPEVASANAMPITLPPQRHGRADPAVLEDLGALVPELTGSGQLGATRRTTDGTARSRSELSWLDSPRGRVRVNRAADGWLSVNTLRHNDLRLALEDLAMIARKENRGT